MKWQSALVVERATHPTPATVEHVGITHGCFHILVAEEFLDRPDIIPILQQMGRKAMAEGVAACVFGNSRRTDGGMDRALETALVETIATGFTGCGVNHITARRKDNLPGPFPIGMGIRALQGRGKGNCTGAACQVIRMRLGTKHQMGLEAGYSAPAAPWSRGLVRLCHHGQSVGDVRHQDP